jgi:hypothetical protein
MIRAAEKAGRGLVRDFGEVENLQVSQKGPSDFVSVAVTDREGAIEFSNDKWFRLGQAIVERAPELVRQWLATHDRITSGDYAAMTGTVRPNANRVLTSLVGDLLERGAEVRGRNAHFTLRAGA